MNLENKVVFVTGTNRGIGKALVDALLEYSVKKIYATARNVESLPKFNDARVVAVKLDISNQDQVKAAAGQAQDVDILINNAGALAFATIATGKYEDLKNDMLINYFGTINMVPAFVPIIAKKSNGAIVNFSSVIGLASMSSVAGYCASKAAVHSLSQALRAELKSKHIAVHCVYPGPIDTDMAKEFNLPKTSPQVTAENVLKGIIEGKEDIYPDPMSMQIGESYGKNPKGLEVQFANM